MTVSGSPTSYYCRFLSLEKKFRNNPEFHIKYQKTIKEHIGKGHPTKIENENSTNNVINYPPDHRVIDINKPSEVRVVLDAGATYNFTSLNGTKYSRVDQVKIVEDSLLKNLKGYGLFKQAISLQIF